MRDTADTSGIPPEIWTAVPAPTLVVAGLACLLSLWLLRRAACNRVRVRCCVCIFRHVLRRRDLAQTYKAWYRKKWRREGRARKRRAKEIQGRPIIASVTA